MAHTCPECGLLCHCGGDIDDCEIDGTKDQDQCSHCEGEEDDRETDDDPTEEEDNRQFSEPTIPSK